MSMKGGFQERSIMEELINCFPERTEMIRKIYPLNKNFREVTDDYFFCKYQISILSGRSKEEMMLITEYESTLKDLEEEMMEYLANTST